MGYGLTHTIQEDAAEGLTWPRRFFVLSAWLRLVIITYQYKIKQVENATFFRIRSYDAPLCPLCGSLCSGYDTRSRSVFGDDGRPVRYMLRRVRCPSCKVLHIELPDFMQPRKRYAAEVINAVLEGHGESCPADDRTMRRWRHENHPPEVSGVLDGGMLQSTYTDKKGDEP